MQSTPGNGHLVFVFKDRCLKVAEKGADCLGDPLERGDGLSSDGGDEVVRENGLDHVEQLG